jgi:hypothetical protein
MARFSHAMGQLHKLLISHIEPARRDFTKPAVHPCTPIGRLAASKRSQAENPD